MPNTAQLTPAKIDWKIDQNGLEVPASTQFGDVYFSQENGLAEAQHVFLQGNGLAERLASLPCFAVFTLGELGFGTGLNILALWQLWAQVRPKNHSRLHIITTEKYPLTQSDLSRALLGWHELSEFSQQLLTHYPPLISGCHRLSFPEARLIVDLWLGDAADNLAKITSHTTVNAWFLDGFAPSCNPELWAGRVFDDILRLSGAGTTTASFSVAGLVKRGLTERGFTIRKSKGFGSKREMLTATLESTRLGCHGTNQEQKHSLDGFVFDYASQRSGCEGVKNQQHIAVIGAGVAGLCSAYSFAQRGHKVTVIDKTSALAGASGNPRAMLAPKLTPIHHAHEHLHTMGYLYAARFYQHIGCKSRRVYERTGVLDVLKIANVLPEQVSDYPAEFATMLSEQAATNKAQTALPQAMHLPDAGLVNPSVLAEVIFGFENVSFLQAKVTQLNLTGKDIQVITNAKQSNQAPKESLAERLRVDMVIICTAQACYTLNSKLPQPRATRGQVSWFTLDDTANIGNIPLPILPIKYGGYCTPFEQSANEAGAHFLLGASFVRGASDMMVNRQEHEDNLAKLKTAMPHLTGLQVCDNWQGRTGLRAQMPDYLPLVGAVDGRIFTLAALGSKGFAYAPLCAEVIAAQALGETAPLPKRLVEKLNPLRFYRSVQL